MILIVRNVAEQTLEDHPLLELRKLIDALDEDIVAPVFSTAANTTPRFTNNTLRFAFVCSIPEIVG